MQRNSVETVTATTPASQSQAKHSYASTFIQTRTYVCSYNTLLCSASQEAAVMSSPALDPASSILSQPCLQKRISCSLNISQNMCMATAQEHCTHRPDDDTSSADILPKTLHLPVQTKSSHFGHKKQLAAAHMCVHITHRYVVPTRGCCQAKPCN
jgi:hypothetical protein